MQLTWCMIAFQLNAKTVDPTAMTMENYKNQAIKEDLNLRFWGLIKDLCICHFNLKLKTKILRKVI